MHVMVVGSAFKHTAASSDLRTQRALDDLGATPAVAAGRESMLFSVACLPECAGAAFASVADTVAAPRFAPWIIKETAASKLVAGELAAFAGDAEAQAMQAVHEAAELSMCLRRQLGVYEGGQLVPPSTVAARVILRRLRASRASSET